MSPTGHDLPELCGLQPVLPEKIGIMADSHGDAGAVDDAAACFRGHGCGSIFHLGDLCDSLRPETAGECLAKLALHRIMAIRGNNEQALLLNRPPEIDAEAMLAMRAMPLTRQVGKALLAHSLPFAAEMGPRCMLEDMLPDHIRCFARRHPGMLLFRGHSHHPEIVRIRDRDLLREEMLPGRLYRLDANESTVITCGALEERLCLIWNRQRESTELIRLGRL
jgi:predicted phosphodiesterase